jgi:hypothetical protein
MGFNKANAQEKPRTAALGRVQAIGEAKVTQSKAYMLVKYELQGYGASPNQNGIFLFRPEWLMEGFNPASLEKFDNGKTFEMIYRKNVASREGMSVLQGLCGGDEQKFDELADRIFALGINDASTEEDVLEGVRGVLQQFLVDEGNGDKVGYTIGHQMSKTDECDENGKPIYVRERFMEIKSWFDPSNEKAVKGMVKRAAKSEGKFVIAFTEDEVPF